MPNISLLSLRDATYSKLDDNTEFYSTTEVTWAINEAIRLGNVFCGWISTTASVISGGTTVANRVIYKVPEGIAIPQKVVFEGKELDKVGMYQLFRNWPTWMKDTTATTGYPVSRWCPYSLNRFAINPADAVGGGLLEVTGIASPTALSSATDTINLPKSVISVIAEYAAHTVQCKLGSVPLTQSIPMFRTYEKMIKQSCIWSRYKQPNMWLEKRSPE